MSDKHTTRRTLASRRKGKTEWKRVKHMTEDEIDAGAASDEENPLWTDAELSAARLVLPSDQSKRPVSIRLDQEVLGFFKEQGPGDQSRINAVLLAYVRSQRQRRKE